MRNSIYDIRLCKVDEVDKVKSFIHAHWKSNHALSVSKSLMDFQHYNNLDIYNFIIALNTKTDEIDGLIGFIPTSQYDIALKNEGDVWGAIWKIRENVVNDEINTLGLYLYESFRDITQFNTYAAIGISRIAKKIYKALKYQTGILNQYYILNYSLNDFGIAKIGANEFLEPVEHIDEAFRIRRVGALVNIEAIEGYYKPKKSLEYFINRYENHPIYSYEFLGIYNHDSLITLLVTRTITVNDAKIIRIVDVLGQLEGLPNLKREFQNLILDENVEYIDCVNFGIDEDVFLSLGFTKLITEGETIIPTYFEPFERKNIELEFAFKSSEKYTIFKGDSDQDRPNIL